MKPAIAIAIALGLVVVGGAVAFVLARKSAENELGGGFKSVPVGGQPPGAVESLVKSIPILGEVVDAIDGNTLRVRPGVDPVPCIMRAIVAEQFRAYLAHVQGRAYVVPDELAVAPHAVRVRLTAAHKSSITTATALFERKPTAGGVPLHPDDDIKFRPLLFGIVRGPCFDGTTEAPTAVHGPHAPFVALHDAVLAAEAAQAADVNRRRRELARSRGQTIDTGLLSGSSSLADAGRRAGLQTPFVGST